MSCWSAISGRRPPPPPRNPPPPPPRNPPPPPPRNPPPPPPRKPPPRTAAARCPPPANPAPPPPPAHGLKLTAPDAPRCAARPPDLAFLAAVERLRTCRLPAVLPAPACLFVARPRSVCC